MSATGGSSVYDIFRRVTQPQGTSTTGVPQPSLLDDLGRISANAAAGRASGRTTQADFNLRSGEAQQGANVQAADATLRQRAAAMADALRGRMLQGTQDATVSNTPYGVTVPTFTGGQRPSNIVGAADLGKQIAARGDANLNASVTPENFSNLAPQPNFIDKALGFAGTAAPLLGTIGKIAGFGKVAASAAPAVAGAGGAASAGGGAAASGGLGSTIGSLATNPFTIAGAAALGIGLAIKKHQNATKGDRNSFAKDAGFPDLASFNNYLSTLGPAGQAARTYGESVVGKHNKQQNQQWMQMVQQAISQHGGR